VNNSKFFPFEQLDLAEKAELVLNEGHYISKSTFYQLEISLYRLEDEFVEMWYDVYNKQIVNIYAMNNRVINPYLKHVALLSPN
jgi:hypothetical protein